MLGTWADRVLARLLPKVTGRAQCMPTCFPGNACGCPDNPNCHKNVYSNCHIVCLNNSSCS
jgi:hypothetical protein